MRYQKITRYDTANGPGIRTVLWVSGCSHHCKGCHNPMTWDPDRGTLFTLNTLDEIIESISPPYISGITFSGGDPLYPDNREEITIAAKFIKSSLPNKSIWLYTGYLYEEVKDLDIMDYIDVLIDGEFILEQRDITLLYRGSPNQRVIDVQSSINHNKLILYKGEDY